MYPHHWLVQTIYVYVLFQTSREVYLVQVFIYATIKTFVPYILHNYIRVTLMIGTIIYNMFCTKVKNNVATGVLTTNIYDYCPLFSRRKCYHLKQFFEIKSVNFCTALAAMHKPHRRHWAVIALMSSRKDYKKKIRLLRINTFHFSQKSC